MMCNKKYGGVLYERLSECGSTTGIRLMTFCECGKRSIEVVSFGLMSRINGLLEIAAKKEIGNERHRL
jgi:hypothetical protein